MRITGTAWGLCAAACLVLGACGGGGGGGSAGASVTNNSSAGSGGSSGGSTSSAGNVVPIVVDSGPSGVGAINTPYVTVTLCSPDGTVCQNIDHVSVDSMSSGFRVMASVLNSSLAATLTQAQASPGEPLAECTVFADGYAWGPVKTATVKIGGEQASSIPVQVIADSAYSSVPPDCSAAAKTAESSVSAFGANGIIGVSVFEQDCGGACVTAIQPHTYYRCPSPSACAGTSATLVQQVQNPVFHFATDNNGVIIELPAIASSGGTNVSGSLVFGIDTQGNNTLGMATILTVDPNDGYLTTIFNNQRLPNSFIDSGSNGLFFADSALPACKSSTGFYCPSSLQSLQATFQSYTGVTSNVSFSVESTDALVQSGNTAFSDVAGSNPTGSDSFDWGLPFFFGRHVFVAIEGRTTSAGNGPFVAY